MHYNPPTNVRAPGWRCCKFASWTDVRRDRAVNTTSGIKHPQGMQTADETINSIAVPAFFELYDLDQDSEQMTNLYEATPGAIKSALHGELLDYFRCQGATCP